MNIFFLMFVYGILSSIGMLQPRHASGVVVVAAAAAAEKDDEAAGAPVMCYLEDSDHCPDSYSEHSTNEEQGITYCYNGTVEPANSWVEGNTPTITVGGTPIQFNTLGNCAAVVTEDGGTTTSTTAGGDPTSASSKAVSFVTQFLFLVVLLLSFVQPVTA